MRLFPALLALTAIAPAWGCSKDKGKGDVSASLMKSATVDAALALEQGNPAPLTTAGTGSSTQSFTPTTLKLPIFKINMCDGESDCQSIYTCSENTVAGCSVELSAIDAFVDTLNASATATEAGKFFDHIGVQFCPDGDDSGIQHITLNGTVRIEGTTYGTHPTDGLVAGGVGEDIAINMKGGCASFYPLSHGFTTSESEATNVRLFFDASQYAYGGLGYGSASENDYLGASSCAGTASAFVCTSVITVAATVDSGNPTTEHYLLADTSEATGGSASSSPTSKMVLYFSSDGSPIGGIMNAFRISGPSISWGNRLGWGLGLYPEVVDANTLSIGEPGGSIMLANWFKAFKRESHTGKYSYDMNGAEVEGDYKATKL